MPNYDGDDFWWERGVAKFHEVSMMLKDCINSQTRRRQVFNDDFIDRQKTTTMSKGALDSIVDDLVEWHNSLEMCVSADAFIRRDLKNLINKHAPNRIGQLR